MSTNEKNITRGGEFIIKETECENVFSPEDFSEEQLMMKQAVSDFIDKEVMPHRERFENKDYKLTEDIMKKSWRSRLFRRSSSGRVWRYGNGICFNNVSM